MALAAEVFGLIDEPNTIGYSAMSMFLSSVCNCDGDDDDDEICFSQCI